MRFRRVNGDSATFLAMNAEMTEFGGGGQREDLESACGGDGECVMRIDEHGGKGGEEEKGGDDGEISGVTF